MGCLYWVALYPVWRVREWTPGIWGSVLFFSTLIAVGVAAILRFHLWFTSRFYPAELSGHRSSRGSAGRTGSLSWSSWLPPV